jgi:hypothetical protein
MSRLATAGISFALLLAGCTRERAPEVADLEFPVAVLYSTASTMLYSNAADLGVMGVQLVINSSHPPVLIDSGLRVFTLEKLRSIHGDLWFVLHPSGNTEVTFELKRGAESGRDAARAEMTKQLEMQTWRTDVQQRRETLARETTLAGMFKVLRDDGE